MTVEDSLATLITQTGSKSNSYTTCASKLHCNWALPYSNGIKPYDLKIVKVSLHLGGWVCPETNAEYST
jgi:hypothetical protein